jgi:hypothetical protein
MSILGLDILLILGRQVFTAYGRGSTSWRSTATESSMSSSSRGAGRRARSSLKPSIMARGLASSAPTTLPASMPAIRFDGVGFAEAFRDRFGEDLPETLNESHRLVIVASELDPSTERQLDHMGSRQQVP